MTPRRAGATGLIVVVAVLIGEHLASGLSPSDHVISEYATSRNGWAMTLGFAAWSVSLGATATTIAAAFQRILVAVAAGGIAIAAIFPTQAIASRVPPETRLTTAGILHDIGSGVATLALLGAVVASVGGGTLTGRNRTVAAIVVSTAGVSFVALLAVGDPAPGLRQRGILLAAIIWQGLVLAASRTRVRRMTKA